MPIFLKSDKRVLKSYKWEDYFFQVKEDKTDRFSLIDLWSAILRDFDIDRADCKLYFDGKGNRSWFRPINDDYVISLLTPIHVKKSVLCHEMAHLITYDRGINDILPPMEGHGKEWLTVYIHLASEYVGYNKNLLIETAGLMGLPTHNDEWLEKVITCS